MNTVKQSSQVSYPPNRFTFKDLEELNPAVSSPTLRLYLKRQLDEKMITRSEEVVSTGKRGRSQHVYIHNFQNIKD
mgnify:CR=1